LLIGIMAGYADDRDDSARRLELAYKVHPA